MSDAFKAFTDDTDMLNIQGDDFTVANGLRHITLEGRLVIGKDKAGLRAALALQAALHDIVGVLEAETSLPEHNAEEPCAQKGTTDNPFV